MSLASLRLEHEIDRSYNINESREILLKEVFHNGTQYQGMHNSTSIVLVSIVSRINPRVKCYSDKGT